MVDLNTKVSVKALDETTQAIYEIQRSKGLTEAEAKDIARFFWKAVIFGVLTLDSVNSNIVRKVSLQ